MENIRINDNNYRKLSTGINKEYITMKDGVYVDDKEKSNTFQESAHEEELEYFTE